MIAESGNQGVLAVRGQPRNIVTQRSFEHGWIYDIVGRLSLYNRAVIYMFRWDVAAAVRYHS